MILLTGAACARRAPGTCAEDIDCAPGHDCKAGACVKRQRLRFDDKPARPEPAPAPTPGAAEGATPPPSDPSLPAAASTIPDAGAEMPVRRRAIPAPSAPPAPPPAIPAPTGPAGREPMWKQRLKNS